MFLNFKPGLIGIVLSILILTGCLSRYKISHQKCRAYETNSKEFSECTKKHEGRADDLPVFYKIWEMLGLIP